MADSSYRIEMVSGMPVVAAPTAIDITTADELRRILLDSVADGHATVVVDMTGTQVCASDGFSVLVGAHRRAVARGGGLRLATVADGPVVRALDLTGVGRFIPTFSSLEEALAGRPAAVIVPTRSRPSPEVRSSHAHQAGSPAEGA